MMKETKYCDQRMGEEELVQVGILVKKKDEELIKAIFHRCKQEHQEHQEGLAFFGHCATDSQILFAKELAKANRIPEPEHLYDYHISLGGWILNVITHLGSGYKITKTE